MKRSHVAGLVVGLVGVTALVAWQGVGTLARALSVAGWRVLWLAPYYFVPLLLASRSWQVVFARGRPPFGLSTYANWVGLSVNWLLPVAMVGGELAKVRIVARRGYSATLALSAGVVDKTMQVATQIAAAVVGLALFAVIYADPALALALAGGTAAFAVAVYLFYRAQTAGLFERMIDFFTRFGPLESDSELLESAEEVDREMREVYRRPALWGASFLWRLVFRFVLVGETWLALEFLGHPVPLGDAVVLETLGMAIRAAAFLIPGGLGAQEGGFVVLGAAVGLSPEVALSLSLCKRVRELAVGVPSLLTWEAEEGRGALLGGKGSGGASGGRG